MIYETQRSFRGIYWSFYGLVKYLFFFQCTVYLEFYLNRCAWHENWKIYSDKFDNRNARMIYKTTIIRFSKKILLYFCPRNNLSVVLFLSVDRMRERKFFSPYFYLLQLVWIYSLICFLFFVLSSSDTHRSNESLNLRDRLAVMAIQLILMDEWLFSSWSPVQPIIWFLLKISNTKRANVIHWQSIEHHAVFLSMVDTLHIDNRHTFE